MRLTACVLMAWLCLTPGAALAAPESAVQQSDSTQQGNIHGGLDESGPDPGVQIVVGGPGTVPAAATTDRSGATPAHTQCAIVPAQPATSGADSLPRFPETLGADEVAGLRTLQLVDGSFYLRYCLTEGVWTLVGVFQFRQGQAAVPVAAVDPAALAQLAVARIDLPAPRPSTAPAMSVDTLVGITTWLWIDPGQWRPLTAEAQAGLLRVTATVTPVSVTWDMGEGRGTEPVVCRGPGTAYRRDVKDDLQQTTCGYVYRWASFDHGGGDRRDVGDDRYHGSATIRWAVHWTASNGEENDLADLSTTTAFDLRVDEVQAVVCVGTPLGQCDAGGP
jgi:hypothetical protein